MFKGIKLLAITGLLLSVAIPKPSVAAMIIMCNKDLNDEVVCKKANISNEDIDSVFSEELGFDNEINVNLDIFKNAEFFESRVDRDGAAGN